MNVVETLRELSEVWKIFGDMPDETTLSVDLAALYLGISVKTLARYRQNGGGPQYIQYQTEDSKARNQRVNYLLKDLRSWRNIHKVNNTMHAAQVRGLTFSSLSDFCEPQPFWYDNSLPARTIISHALTLTDKEFKELLLKPYTDVVWISIEKALFQTWENKDERTIWHKVFISVLNSIVCASDAEQERYTLNDALKS
ncbi:MULTISPECIES: hypothetical protein [Enterobacterales]|uniref:Uncharacterized protein n=2 Tax=Enterobacteriaceae TaxID=543 RepID=A0A1V2GE93_ECOLX|nr:MULTISPECIES: hypothetical protein [Enterobacterales]EHP7597636.1 hypothetical protein [Salmonella enterica]HDX9148842.1 hypothetical protein [Klebsiella michiganensis]EHT9936681.1 hypothetical protein [Serratia marcescens]EIJ6676602.1 hypothetical protein [Serratia marcescens]MBL4338287.1 hypothetical protein [Klebsiella pneumoniae]